MEDAKTLQVKCPCCQALLTVDPADGEVLMHKEAKPVLPVTDIAAAAQALKKDAGRRAEMFQKSLESEKNRPDSLKKKFDEALRRAKEDPDAPPPRREIDLD